MQASNQPWGWSYAAGNLPTTTEAHLVGSIVGGLKRLEAGSNYSGTAADAASLVGNSDEIDQGVGWIYQPLRGPWWRAG